MHADRIIEREPQNYQLLVGMPCNDITVGYGDIALASAQLNMRWFLMVAR
jgi:hypothetical protein